MANKSGRKKFVSVDPSELGFTYGAAEDTFNTPLLRTKQWEDDSSPHRGLGELKTIAQIIIEVFENKRRRGESEDATVDDIVAHAPFLAKQRGKVTEVLRMLALEEVLMTGSRGRWTWYTLEDHDIVRIRYLPQKERQDLRARLAALAPYLT
jgi:hypothetical protein